MGLEEEGWCECWNMLRRVGGGVGEVVVIG